MQEAPVWILGQEDPLEKGHASTSVFLGFPGGSDGKESTCDVGGLGSIPGLGRSPGGGQGNPLQYSCLENSMDRNLVGYSPGGCKESDTTERLNTAHACWKHKVLSGLLEWVFKTKTLNHEERSCHWEGSDWKRYHGVDFYTEKKGKKIRECPMPHTFLHY